MPIVNVLTSFLLTSSGMGALSYTYVRCPAWRLITQWPRRTNLDATIPEPTNETSAAADIKATGGGPPVRGSALPTALPTDALASSPPDPDVAVAVCVA